MADDPQKLLRKEALRKLKSTPLTFLIGLLGLYVFPIIVFKAVKEGRVEWPNRFGPNVLISYHDHPWAYSWIVVIAVLGIFFCLGLVWTYFFKRIPD